MHYSFDKELDDAIQAATNYVETRQSQKKVLQEISHHDQFKRHAEPTTKVTYPTELVSKVSEKEQSGARVAAVLKKMYDKKKHSAEQCREVAQQYLNYAKLNFPNADMKEVRVFLTKMNNVLKEKSESIAKHKPLEKQGVSIEQKQRNSFFKEVLMAVRGKPKSNDGPKKDDSSKENDTSMLY
jgi:hypothetical protein